MKKNTHSIQIDKYGTKRYYVNNSLHREDGPAVEWFNGSKEWYKDGKHHREDGPAEVFNVNFTRWWFNDNFYGYNDEFTNESWKKFIKTLIFS